MLIQSIIFRFKFFYFFQVNFHVLKKHEMYVCYFKVFQEKKEKKNRYGKLLTIIKSK